MLDVPVFTTLMLLLVARAHGDCLVSIAQGTARGSLLTSYHGKEFCSYNGIPYAAPPVGDLRFRAPEPASAWTGELNATKPGNSCIQGALSFYFGDEDCLYLNVHTPQTSTAEELLPVMVFIHGGAFIFGNGKAYSYGPHYLMDKEVVMVSMNYRLGVFGFLSTGDDAAPGNYAMKDQLEALRWVQKNIAAFGGDPNKVTIMGESAGSMSVHFHILSPASRGLFHAAISDSGTAMMPMFLHAEGMLGVAQQQAEAVNCPTDNTANMMECLRQVDAPSLIIHPPGACSTTELELRCFFDLMWRPVPETQSALNPEPFLTAFPQDIIQSGNFSRVPYLIGTNGQEGALFLIPFIGTQNAVDKLNLNNSVLTDSSFFLEESVSDDLMPEIWNQILDFYVGSNHTFSADNMHLLIDACTDRLMQHNTEKAVKLHTQAGHDTIYLYNLQYRGKYSFITKARYGDLRYDLGVLHIDELQYYISYGSDPNKWEAGHPDLEVLETVLTLWTNLAKYGHPTPSEENAPQGVVWPSVGAYQDQLAYYLFGHQQPPIEPVDGIMPLNISVARDLFSARMDFWNSLPLKENQYQ
ncbi:juvenile hormone esterase-like [Periplaneta americana]|uniref:juvenile hormone esterase-like n=1 Tax=Periplaneta americana TaxID=6978 RepID=UPI0037E7181D